MLGFFCEGKGRHKLSVNLRKGTLRGPEGGEKAAPPPTSPPPSGPLRVRQPLTALPALPTSRPLPPLVCAGRGGGGGGGSGMTRAPRVT